MRRYAPVQAVPSFMPGKRSPEAVYREPSGAVPSQAVMPVAPAPMQAYQVSLQAFYVTPKVSDNSYAAPRTSVEGHGSARAEPVGYTEPPHVAGLGRMIGRRGGEPRRGRSSEPYQPAYQHPSYSALPVETNSRGAAQGPRSSESTADAPVRTYRPGFRDPFAKPRGFPPPAIPFTRGSSSSDGRPAPSQGR